MFRKILIANRGEIACRVIATARRLGVKTVAVYSDADAGAKHVAMADEAVRIGAPPAAESYLRSSVLLAAAQDTGAEAIHPGYGFLSENPEFAEAVVDAGLVFIGPPAGAIRAMGLKDAAKKRMEAAGVRVVPGYHGAQQDAALLAVEADKIGYPVLIKARAGGGGKGMRQVDTPAQFSAAYESARREAEASFGDPACLIEKYVSRPRHIEIQIFADGHGNCIHLFERDCSLQRRHQKVIEEAPAPGMTESLRAAMGQAAVQAARAIGYCGAGTVEFIVDGSGPLRDDGFWFMEMNTRLQVEHPVTEAITGIDLVEWQMRVAAGEPLPLRQGELSIDGHAVEARIYAEDPERDFLPATGRLIWFTAPVENEFQPGPLRIDSGVREGDEICPWYDPLIAKVVAHAPSRPLALARLSSGLGQTQIAGTTINIGFLQSLAGRAEFVSGAMDTSLIARTLPALTARLEPPEPVVAIAMIESLGLLDHSFSGDPWTDLVGWRHWEAETRQVRLKSHGTLYQREIRFSGRGRFQLSGGTEPLDVECTARDDRSVVISIAGHRSFASVAADGAEITVFRDGQAYVFECPVEGPAFADATVAGNALHAPMPGLVKLVSAQPGDAVTEEDTLVVLEAMKMEHAIRPPRAGTVKDLFVAPGDQVVDGAVLLTLESPDE